MDEGAASDGKTDDSTEVVEPDDEERFGSTVKVRGPADAAKIPTEAQAIATYLLMQVQQLFDIQ